ncbi:MAG: lipid II flippase MurJ [Patescibacteria group bacterium]
MVKKLFQLFHREFSGLHQAAFLLAGAGLLADLLALFRDRLLASTFGADRALDIYFVSFRVPDFLYTTTLLIAANTALIPILLKKFSEDEKKAQYFMGGIFAVFFLITAFLVLIFFWLMPFLMTAVAPGLEGADKAQAVLLSRILLLSPVLLGLSNLVSSVIQSFRRFFIYALSPIFYNFGIIAGVLFFYPFLGLAGLAWGVALGALLHFLVQIPSLVRLGFWANFRLVDLADDLWQVIKLSFPRTLGLSLNQLVLIVITAIASTLAVGSISVFNFANNLQSVPLSLIGISYSVAAFPTMARFFVKNNKREFFLSFLAAFRHIIFWSVPATFLFIVLRAQIVRVILGAGVFNWTDTRLTAAALLLLSLSIISQGLVMLLVRAFYAADRTIFPLVVNSISSVLIIGLSFFLVWFLKTSQIFSDFFSVFLRTEGLEGISMLALPLAFSLGSLVNVFLLGAGFYKIFSRSIFAEFSDWESMKKRLVKSFLEIGFAGLAVGMTSYFSLRLFDNILNLETFIGVFSQGILAGFFGLLAGALTLWVFDNEEFLIVAGTFHQKFWKASVISQEPEKLP